jgi:hypothetical protein
MGWCADAHWRRYLGATFRMQPGAVGLKWQGFSQGRTVREEARGGVSPAVFYRSKFEISGALLRLCSGTACQIGPDHEVMKRPEGAGARSESSR